MSEHTPAVAAETAGTAAVLDFWERRDSLAHVLAFARARMVSPWALLGAVLSRVIAATPPQAVLPALVGGHASLNLFVALVGASGGGKGATEAAAIDAIDLPPVHSVTVGSGEGLARLYVRRDKGTLVRERFAVLASVPEVDTLTALGARQGSTLLGQLRSAWAGEQLGFAYADQAKALPVERHTYRLALNLGVQPGRAAPLLDDADGGTPQRFVWLPTTDPDAPDVVPAEPEQPWRVARQLWQSEAKGLTVIPVPAEASSTVVAARQARLRGHGEALDGHALLCRLKVAAALALLDGRRAVSSEDWALSGTVMAVSERTRAGVLAHLAETASKANTARGRAEGERAAVAEEASDEKATQRVARRVARHLADQGETAASDVRRGLNSRDRAHFGPAVARLIAAGQVVERGTEKGTRLALASKADQ